MPQKRPAAGVRGLQSPKQRMPATKQRSAMTKTMRLVIIIIEGLRRKVVGGTQNPTCQASGKFWVRGMPSQKKSLVVGWWACGLE